MSPNATFFNIEMAAESPDFKFAPAHVAAYQEPTELTALAEMDRHPKWRKWMNRIIAIRKIPHF